MKKSNLSFFQNNANKLAPLTLNGKRIYRECQIGASWATLAHFTSSSEPALISMPTGSGKTALMMMLSFLLKAKRVIIITPSVALRGQTATKFKDLKDIKEINAFPEKISGPRVLDHEGQLSAIEAWNDFLKYDVIVATPHTTSPGYEEIVGPPPGLFDSDTLVFFDEAHHSRARTWQVLMKSFSNSHIVLLTATPFRNDNRRLLAKLVYHYPMKKALDAHIYAPITYHAVESLDSRKKDSEICSIALSIYYKQKEKHPSARMLIRAEGVTKSKELLKLYKDAGLRVEEVNYKQTIQDNKKALDGVRSGELDGIICIDQIGEGLDIPNLKIAVLHKPRQSFPATIQFIGRICREVSGTIGEPHLIACPDDVRGPLQKLYTHDNSWREFVPELVERTIGKNTKLSVFHNMVDVESELDLKIEDIKPFFSVRVYKNIKSEAPDIEALIDLREEVVPVLLYKSPDKNMFVIITAIEKSFPWAEESNLVSPHYDLHIFYWQESTMHLFEHTTSDKIANMIRNSLWGDAINRIDPATIAKALKINSPSKYLMFGLTNLLSGTGSVPSYKTFLGNEVEGAIRPSDSRSFTPGHALAKYNNGETRGIGSNQARVWSIKRAPLEEFKKWCDGVGSNLNKGGDGRLPNVNFLPSPESISKFPTNPLAIYTRWNPSLLVSFNHDKDIYIEGLSFDKLKLSKDAKSIEGELRMGGDNYIIETNFIYSLNTPYWDFENKSIPQIKVDDGQEYHKKALSEFLDTYPPIIVLADGSSVIGGCRYELKQKLTSLPKGCIDTSFDWQGCDIYIEFEYHDSTDPSKSKIPKLGKKSVQDHLEKFLDSSDSSGSLIIKDHAPGEIADFIEISTSDLLIRFYHCKACSPKKKPGARLNELLVLEQVIRNVNHIGSNSLLPELYSRVIGSDRKDTKMVKGTSKTLYKQSKTFNANEWKFEVVIVNPGIDCNKSIKTSNTNTILIACYEWLATANTKFRVIGT